MADNKAGPKSEIVRRPQRQINPAFINPAPLPEELKGLIDVKGWLASLTTGVEYKEPNPDYMAQRMLMMALTSASVEELLSDPQMDGLQDLIPDAPWQGTGNILITGLYVARSDLTEGQRTYMLLSYFTDKTGEETTTTTGATRLQIQMAGQLAMGVWPIEGQIKRTDRKDRGGRHLFSFYPLGE
jgi:hypothetical protein